MNWKILYRGEDVKEQLLLNRGMKTKRQKEQFFNPKLSDFAKDFEIKNLDIAKKRILKAIKNEELIFVSGDYDVDGICGAAVLYLGLTSIGAKVLPYIPHREKEGYGLSKIGLDLAKEKGASLVITVDCGIVDFEEALYAKKLKLDLVITDHHQPMKKRPQCLTAVHSTKICGAAVAWCLVKKLTDATFLLDLVAIATVADMMPMLGVNRAIVREGLEVLKNTKKVGLKALANEVGINLLDIGSYEVGHIIAPRLNALGRLDHAMDALRLLCTKNLPKAIEFAKRLDEVNSIRKKLTLEAVEIARLKITQEIKKVYILSDSSWNPGIIGLVAGRVMEETGRPVVVIALGEEHSKGSARSVDGINIVEVIRKCADILVAVGGHPGAAGFTIQTTKIAQFQKRVEELLDGEVVNEERALEVEAEIKSRDLSLEFAKSIILFEPFGVKNKKPLFATFKTRLADLKVVGEGKHLKGNVILDFTSEGRKVPFIGFNFGEMKELLDGQLVDVAYNLEINSYRGVDKLQLNIKDIKIA